MTKRTIEQELDVHGRSFFQTVGNSMEPILHNRKSTVVIEKKRAPLKHYDVALYHSPTDEYVLHRVIKVKHGEYLICGDNCLSMERVPEEWVIGVMVGYYEDEKNNYISCESDIYRKYLETLKKRHFLLWRHNLVNRIKGYIRGLLKGKV